MECTNDALRKYFANNKTDQKGTQSKYPRHIYANSIEWVVYPIFYLGVYFGRFNNVPKLKEIVSYSSLLVTIHLRDFHLF